MTGRLVQSAKETARNASTAVATRLTGWMPDSASKTFPAFVVREPRADGAPVSAGVEWLAESDLPPGEVTIQVEWSSLNYKDALAHRGNRGVIGGLPHVPGIDAAGTVIASDAGDCRPGDAVLVTGYGLGSPDWGAHSARIRVPADWVVALPAGLTPRQAMTFGTAGFTAAQAVMALERAGLTPVKGEVLVTGATGGVGVFAVAILAKLGYQVVAMTGKPDRAAALRQLGAVRTVGRDLFAEAGDRPMLSEAWAGGVDTVGGDTLSALLRSTSHRGCVAACGLVGGHHLPITVYPFLLRGVTLAGIDSAKCPREPRLEVWRRLAGPWRVDLPEELVTEVTLDELPNRVDEMLAGRTFGRTLVKPTTTTAPAAE